MGEIRTAIPSYSPRLPLLRRSGRPRLLPSSTLEQRLGIELMISEPFRRELGRLEPGYLLSQKAEISNADSE